MCRLASPQQTPIWTAPRTQPPPTQSSLLCNETPPLLGLALLLALLLVFLCVRFSVRPFVLFSDSNRRLLLCLRSTEEWEEVKVFQWEQKGMMRKWGVGGGGGLFHFCFPSFIFHGASSSSLLDRFLFFSPIVTFLVSICLFFVLGQHSALWTETYTNINVTVLYPVKKYHELMAQYNITMQTIERISGAGIAQWLEHRTRDWKVAGSNPCWNGGRIFFSRVDFLCWLLFRYPFHPRVTAVARKKSRSFCQKCRWQVTAKHAYTLRMWILLNRASALVTTCP